MNNGRKPTMVWNPVTAKWDQAPEKDTGTGRLDVYTVAVQKGEGKSIEVGDFMASNDGELIELVCRHFSVHSEKEFTILDIHKKAASGGIVVVRESAMAEWPKVPVITRKGMIMKSYPKPVQDLQAVSSNSKPVTNWTTTPSADAWKVSGETYIKRNNYTLRTGT